MPGKRPPRNSRLRAVEVRKNLVFERVRGREASVTAWFVLAPQQWQFRGEEERGQLIDAAAVRWARLPGRKVHLRVTHVPYPANVWARRLHESIHARGQTPLPDVTVDGVTYGWAQHLVAEQNHLRGAGMSDRLTLAGVRLKRRSAGQRIHERWFDDIDSSEIAKLDADHARVTEIMAGPGLGGRPASRQQMQYLFNQSVGLGLPSLSRLSPAAADVWEPEDMPELADTAERFGQPFDRVTRVVGLVDGEQTERYTAVLAVGRTDEMWVPDAEHDPLMVATERLGFPVEWSARVTPTRGVAAVKSVMKRLGVVRDMQREYGKRDMDEPLDLEEKAAHAQDVANQMTQGSELESTRVYGYLNLAVSGESRRECEDRAKAVVDMYADRSVTIAWPKGQFAYADSFIPGQPLASTAYLRRWRARYFSQAAMNVSTTLGDRRGFVLGRSSGLGRQAVCEDPHYATERKKRSGTKFVTGSQGAGKSVLELTIAEETAWTGERVILNDATNRMAALTRVPYLAAVSRHVDYSRGEQGCLSPYTLYPEPRRVDYDDEQTWRDACILAKAERTQAAIDQSRANLPSGLADAELTEAALMTTAAELGGDPGASVQVIAEKLKGSERQEFRMIGAALEAAGNLPMGNLWYLAPAGGYDPLKDEEPALLEVHTFARLEIPSPGSPKTTWTPRQRSSVPLLQAAIARSSQVCWDKPRTERVTFIADEIGQLGEWESGKALYVKITTATRGDNIAAYIGSQNPGHILALGDVENLLGGGWVGRTRGFKTQGDALELLGIARDVGYEQVLGGLSEDPDAPFREFIELDADGNVGKMLVDNTHRPELMEHIRTDSDTPVQVEAGLLGLTA